MCDTYACNLSAVESVRIAVWFRMNICVVVKMKLCVPEISYWEDSSLFLTRRYKTVMELTTPKKFSTKKTRKIIIILWLILWSIDGLMT